MPSWAAGGMAQMAANIQMITMLVMALGSCDMVWAHNGWQMAT